MIENDTIFEHQYKKGQALSQSNGVIFFLVQTKTMKPLKKSVKNSVKNPVGKPHKQMSSALDTFAQFCKKNYGQKYQISGMRPF